MFSPPLSSGETGPPGHPAPHCPQSLCAYTQWVAFGGGGIIAVNDRNEQRKVIKYNHLVSSLVILHTVNEMSKVLGQLKKEGHEFSREALAALSPYRREHTNRFGDYALNLERVPEPLSNNDFIIQIDV